MGIFIMLVVVVSLALYIEISIRGLSVSRSSSYLGILDRLSDRYKIIAATPALLIAIYILMMSLFSDTNYAENIFKRNTDSIEDLLVWFLSITAVYLITDYLARKRKDTIEYGTGIIDTKRLFKKAKLYTNINGVSLISLGVIYTGFLFLKVFS